MKGMRRPQAFETALALLLVILACTLYLMIITTPKAVSGWEVQGTGSADHLFVGSNNTLYAFEGNNIKAIDNKGKLLWEMTVSDEWEVLNTWAVPEYSNAMQGQWTLMDAYPMVGENDGWLYLLEVGNFSAGEIESMANYTYAITRLRNDPTLHLTKLSTARPGSGAGEFVPADHQCRVVAVSPEGTVEWEYPFTINLSKRNTGQWKWYDPLIYQTRSTNTHFLADPVTVDARDGRVFVWHDYTEDVLDGSGRLLFSLPGVAAPAAVDADGRIYAVAAASPAQVLNLTAIADPENVAEAQELYHVNNAPYWVTGQHYGEDIPRMLADPDYRIPSGTVNAFDRDGHLLWSTDLGERVAGKYVAPEAWRKYCTMPLYANDTLYLPVVDGVAALDRDGRVEWVRHIVPGHSNLFGLMPVDEAGNVYTDTYMYGVTYVSVTSPAGTFSQQAVELPTSSILHMGALASADGIIYTPGYGTYDYQNWSAGNDAGTWSSIQAVDIATGKEKWSFAAPPGDVRYAVLNADNFDRIVPGPGDRIRSQDANSIGMTPDNYIFLYGMPALRVYPGDGIVYVDYYDVRYEYPLVINSSKCAYVRELYALDVDGRVLWSKPMDSFITAAAANNSTIFYGTRDGRLGGSTTNVVAGLALVATVYLFLRFLLFGTVARARSRLDKNENRNATLQYVASRPGATAVEIARDTRLNLGTVRYHLFILAANHKIVTHREDGKFVRYFTNGNSYTGEERAIVSLLRRGPVRKVLKTLLERPGLSNLELSRELGISAASAHKQMNELLDRGLVNKVPNDEGGFDYFIREERCGQISKMMDCT